MLLTLTAFTMKKSEKEFLSAVSLTLESNVCLCEFSFFSLKIQSCLSDGAGVPGVSCRVAESQGAAGALICVSVFAPESAAFGSA